MPRNLATKLTVTLNLKPIIRLLDEADRKEKAGELGLADLERLKDNLDTERLVVLDHIFPDDLIVTQLANIKAAINRKAEEVIGGKPEDDPQDPPGA